METADFLAASKLDARPADSVVRIEVAWRANRAELMNQKKAAKTSKAQEMEANTTSLALSVFSESFRPRSSSVAKNSDSILGNL